MKNKTSVISATSTLGVSLNEKIFSSMLSKVSKVPKDTLHFLSGHQDGADQELFKFAMWNGFNFTSYCPQWELKPKEQQQIFKDNLLINDSDMILYFLTKGTNDKRVLQIKKIAKDNGKTFVIIDNETGRILDHTKVAEAILK